MKNYYQILGIDPSTTPEEVKKAYFSLAKKYHPDSGDETEVQQFHLVSEAYRVLSDVAERKKHDLALGLEAEIISSSAVPDSPVSTFKPASKKDHEREASLKAFYKNRFKKAVFRVLSFTLLLALVGYLLGIILSGKGFLGALAGLFIGFSFGVNRHFDVSTFFELKRKQKLFELFTWGLFGMGLGYFVWLIVGEIF